jgi:hypothetical protein
LFCSAWTGISCQINCRKLTGISCQIITNLILATCHHKAARAETITGKHNAFVHLKHWTAKEHPNLFSSCSTIKKHNKQNFQKKPHHSLMGTQHLKNPCAASAALSSSCLVWIQITKFNHKQMSGNIDTELICIFTKKQMSLFFCHLS